MKIYFSFHPEIRVCLPCLNINHLHIYIIQIEKTLVIEEKIEDNNWKLYFLKCKLLSQLFVILLMALSSFPGSVPALCVNTFCFLAYQVELPGCKGIWTVYHKSTRSHDTSKIAAADDEYHAYLIISLEARTMVMTST